MKLTKADLPQEVIEEIAGHYSRILTLIGEDPSREGLRDTPMRAAKALSFVTSGYRTNLDDVVVSALFSTTSSGMVIVKDIEFYSLCEHHILPFFGHVSIGYFPEQKIVGLSKVARVVDALARRLQVQEQLTNQIAQELYRLIDGCKGVAVRCEARHMCMMMRGVEKQESSTVTVAASGCFAGEPQLMQQFLNLVG